MRRTGKLSCEGVATIIVVVMLLGVCVWILATYYRARTVSAPFDAMREQTQTACAQCSSLGREFVGAPAPYRRGKVLVVEADTGKVVGLTMADMSAEVRASGPEEVGTVVCVREVEERHVDTYQDKQPAYRLYRDVCIYDRTLESVILVEKLAGREPPRIKTKKGPESGSDPIYHELISLLEALPVK